MNETLAAMEARHAHLREAIRNLPVGDHKPRTQLQDSADAFKVPPNTRLEFIDKLKDLILAIDSEVSDAYSGVGFDHRAEHEIRLWIASGRDLVDDLYGHSAELYEQERAAE